MNEVWALTIDDYLEVVKRCQEKGIKPGESMQEVFIEYMKEKNVKPIGTTDLDADQITGELRENGKKVLNLNELERQIKNKGGESHV